MTVKKLISILKKMPQNLQVGISAHDNSDWEIAGWPTRVNILDKNETKCPEWVNKFDRECYDVLPEKIVVIHC